MFRQLRRGAHGRRLKRHYLCLLIAAVLSASSTFATSGLAAEAQSSPSASTPTPGTTPTTTASSAAPTATTAARPTATKTVTPQPAPSGSPATSSPAQPVASPAAAACPAGWTCADIGSPASAGAESLANGTWTVSGSGWDIWGNADQIHFVSQSLVGDGSISARLASQGNSGPWAKAGLVVRTSLDPGAPFFAILVTPQNGIIVEARSSAGASATLVANTSGSAPVYLKVGRVGTTFTAYTSTDGTTWGTLGRATLSAMSGTVLAGIGATANSSGTDTVSFDSVTLATASNDGCPSGWACSDIGNPPLVGGQSVNDGKWTVQSSGYDISGAQDQFHFVSQPLSGDGGITAHVSSQGGTTGTWAKAGLMLRSSDDPSAPFFGIFVTPAKGIEIEARSTPGATASVLLNGAGGAPLYLKVDRVGSTFTAYTSADGITWATAGRTTLSGVSGPLVAGIATTSNAAGLSTVAMDSVAPTSPPATSCPSGWSCSDIGNPPVAGTQTLANGTWSIESSGYDIGGSSDQFHFVSQVLSGDGGISARIATQGNSGAWAKGGVMLRTSADPAAPYFAIMATPGNGLQVTSRAAQGDGAVQVYNGPGQAPMFLKVERSGNTFTASTSADGSNWKAVTATSLSGASGPLLAGLASTSNSSSVGTDTFDAVALTAAPANSCPSGWTCADIGNPSPVGNQSVTDSAWSVQGSGSDIFGSSDQFHFLWKPLSGDGGISAELTSQASSGPWAKAGIMLRSSTDPGSPFYAALMTPTNGLQIEARTTQGGNATVVTNSPAAFPILIKVARSGGSYTTYTSSDNLIWTAVPGSTVSIAVAPVLAGVAATANSPSNQSGNAVLTNIVGPGPGSSEEVSLRLSPPMSTQSAPVASSGYLFGTLGTLTDEVTNEYAAGVRVAHLELGWDSYEPLDGVFDPNYAAAVKQKLEAFQAAGMKVVLGAGLQYPPPWVFSYPGSRYVDQYGDADSSVNLTFNATLRNRAALYLARVAHDLGPSNFWAVRVGAGGLVEVNYPPENANGHNNAYWSFDPAAQGATPLPATISPNPFPGWKPGNTTYNGQAFSTAQVQQWYDWYLGALVDGVNWQIATYKQLGFDGFNQVLMAGIGSRPDEYSEAIAGYLGGTGDSNATMGRGGVWNKVIDGLSDRKNVVVYVSSLADGSGADNVCQPSDANVQLADSQIDSWSAARWISYNANRYSMPKMGENPGRSSTRYGPATMQAATAQMQACGLQGLMWAQDSDLYDSGSGVSLQTYANTIASYPH